MDGREVYFTKVHKIIGKKLWYMEYHAEGMAPGPDYSWLKNIKLIKNTVNNTITTISSSTNNQPFTIPACNQYARLMKCVADKSG
jgi:hypothetical protein